MNPQHTHLVIATVHILEAFMGYSNPADTLFRDLGGLSDTVKRLKIEVTRVAEGVKFEREELKLSSKGKAAMVYTPLLYRLGYEDVNSQSSQVTGQAETLTPHHQRLLLKALLRAIAHGIHAPGNSTRLHISEESDLSYCLRTIFRHAKEFGGAVFSLAASVMSDLIHKDPTCFATLDAAGLPSGFLDAITAGVLPSSEAVRCIPNSLDALCLNISGLQAVRDRNALGCFVKIFTSKVYVRALANDERGSLALGLDELLRQAPSLRGPGIDMCIKILKTIAAIGGAPVEPAVPVDASDSSSVDALVPVDTDVEERSSATPDNLPRASPSLQQPQYPAADLETFLPDCINNAVRLLETVLKNADTSRVFIEKKGIEALLQLYTLPHLPVSFGGSSTAHNMSVIFCALSPRYLAVLTLSVCGALTEHLQATLDQLKLLSGTKLSDLDTGERNKFVRSLSAAECYLSLSSTLVRRSNPMMTKLTLVTAEVLGNVVAVHREVLWQIAQIDDAKFESKKEAEAGSSTPASVGVGTATREGGDVAEPYPVVRYVNPVHIRNGPSSHLGVESEFLPVLHASDNAEAPTQIARLGRLARQAGATQVDTEGVAGPSESPPATEVTKRKSPESMNYDMMTRLTAAARRLYVALGKAMLMPSLRWDGIVHLTPDAKMVAGTLANLFAVSLRSRGLKEASHGELSVICRYLGKVVEDMLAVVFDSKQRTCNTVLLNNLYGCGAIKELLKSFAAISQLLWTLLQGSGGSPMGTENGKSKAEKSKEKAVANSWLFDILRNYARLMKHLVTSSLLLTPAPMAQLLIQPLAGLSKTLAKDPEAFVRSLQAQVLEVVFPVWNHPQFAQCSATFITSIASIITNVYTGVGDAKEAAQEDDELARALALSLGSEEESAPDNQDEESAVDHRVSQALLVEDMLLTCMTLLQNTEAVAFPLSDLLVTMCNRNKGQDRTQVISYLVRQLKSCKVDGSMTDTCPLSTISLTLALVLSKDSTTREIAAECGAVSIALDVLEQFRPVKTSLQNEIPKWLTTLLLVLDHMLVCKLKIISDQPSGSATAATASTSMGISSGTPAAVEQLSEALNMQKETAASLFISVLGKSSGYMSEDEQRRAVSVAAGFLQMQLPSATVQAVLQLCAHLTKSYPIASAFFDSGGLAALLRLPRSCLFPVFDTVAAAIIRHLLEDPQTLQQAMESEIRHTLITTLSRHNGRVSPRMFLTAMAPVVSRDPAIFMQTASIVCQLETVGGRPTVVLAKEKEKDKDKDKEKEKEKEKGQEKIPEKSRSVDVDMSTKVHESGKIARGHHHKKVVPHSFSSVIDQLLDVILHYPSATADPVHDKEEELSLKDNSTAMDVDESEVKDKGKGKIEDLGRPKSADMSESSAAKITFFLTLITDIILVYSSAVSVVLGRDLESSEGRGPSQGGVEVVGHGGLLYHILHRLLPYPVEKVNDKVIEEEWREKLSDKAACFVMVVCVRSGEGRRRVAMEIARALTSALPTSSGLDSEGLKGLQSLVRKVRAFVDLVNSVLSSHSPFGGAQAPGFSQDMAKSMMDAGMVEALTRTLQVIDLDHPDAPKLVNSILKGLEALTRADSMTELAYGSDGAQPQARDETMRDSVPQDTSVPEVGPSLRDSKEIVREEQMEYDDDFERYFAGEAYLEEESEEDVMREPAEDAAELEVMHYRMERGPDDEIVDEEDEDEEDMAGDEGEDDGEEDEDDMNSDGDIVQSEGRSRLVEIRWLEAGRSRHQLFHQGMNLDDGFGSFRRPGGSERRRAATYRPFLDRPGAERGGAFHHPLLTRPSATPRGGVTTEIASNSVWNSTSGIVRDLEAMLRGIGGVDFTMYPVYLMGRLGGRTESRLSSWTDDGRPQAGAQALEEQFVEQLRLLVPSAEPVAVQFPAVT